MKVRIDDQEYTVPAEEEIVLLRQVKAMLLEQYGKLSSEMRFAAKPFARGYLQKLENEARAKYGKEQALVFRPDKKQDAVVHLAGIMMGVLREALQHVTIEVSTDDHTIASFAFQLKGADTSGGSLVADGNVRQWQDNGPQVS